MQRLKRRFLLSCAVAAWALLLVQHAGADSFTITSGQPTVTTTQILNEPDDVGTVEQGATIDTTPPDGTGGNGIAAAANGVTVINAGSVTGSGVGTAGIHVLDISTIINSGTASGYFGINAHNNNTITNSGTADGEAGIYILRKNTITNLGTAKGWSYGISAEDDNTINNLGTAVAGFYGIQINNNNTVTNSGTAQGGTDGIFAFFGNTIINSGKIVGGINAVEFYSFENTLKLLSGSTIEGNLALGEASNTLIIGRGLDTALAFTGTPTITTDGVPFVVSGNTVYAVNATSFSVQDEMTNDLTRAVTGAVEGRLASARRTGGGLSVAMNGLTIAATADVSVAPRTGLWLSGLAAYRDQEEDGDVAAFETMLGGVVGGIDGMVTDTTRAGLFAGFAASNLDPDDDALQDLDSDSWFGGVYLGHAWNQAFIDLTLTAGWSDFESKRRVANNMVKGGIEQAEADYGGFLLSPSLRIGTDMAMGSGTLTPSVRLRYAGLFLEDYEEKGSAAALDVDERTVHVFDLRGELAYGFGLGNLSNTIRLGIDGTFSNAGDVEATLAGAALDIQVAEDSLARGFLGYDADYALSDSARLTFSAEAGYDTTEAVSLEARAGFSWTF